MSADPSSLDPELVRLGQAVRGLREAREESRSRVARRAGLSLRYLAQLESGHGNVSYLKLRAVAGALGVDLADLVRRAESPGRPSVSLLGMRGAGKSTVGRALAARLEIPFVELDDVVAQEAAMPLEQIFELQGESFYRRLEQEALSRVLVTGGPSVIATGGGIVTEPGTFAVILRDTVSVWLKASPRDHWSRVIRQGDSRPMRDRPEAMSELERLWAIRAPLYSRADLVIETSDRAASEVTEEIIASLSPSE